MAKVLSIINSFGHVTDNLAYDLVEFVGKL